MGVCDPSFRNQLTGFDLGDLDRHETAVYGVWPDWRIGMLNDAWYEFALDNEGEHILADWGVGASVKSVIPAPLEAFYVTHWTQCLESGEPWSHVYECSSPTLLRKFHMRVYPLSRQSGLLVINSLVFEGEHDREVKAAESGLYTGDNGLIRHCSHCRRTQRADSSEQWDWVPEYVQRMPENATGSLCDPCWRHHYPEVAQSSST